MKSAKITRLEGKMVTISAIALDGTKIEVVGTLQDNGDILTDDGKVWRIIDSSLVCGEEAKR